MTKPRVPSVVNEIESLVERGDYEYYGLRVVTSLHDYPAALALGLPARDVPLTVGQIAPPSYQWDDRGKKLKDCKPTNEQLDGTCAMNIFDDFADEDDDICERIHTAMARSVSGIRELPDSLIVEFE
jgi:hypothetical protein